MVYS
jgi:hypothetical protein